MPLEKARPTGRREGSETVLELRAAEVGQKLDDFEKTFKYLNDRRVCGPPFWTIVTTSFLVGRCSVRVVRGQDRPVHGNTFLGS